MNENVPLYPQTYRKAQTRVLAVRVSQRNIITETGQLIDWPASYLDLRRIMLERNLLLFVPAIPWAESALAMRDSVLYSNADHRFVGLRLRNGRDSRSIGLSESWPGISEPSGLTDLRYLLCQTGVGDHVSPASLGQALMRKHWPRHSLRLRRPPWQAWQDLHENISGGRSELYRPGRWTNVTEEDVNSAYPFALNSVPAGLCMHLDVHENPVWGPTAKRYAWWFAHYRWRIPPDSARRLPLAVLGVRSQHQVKYLIESWPEWHEGWYTKEEIFYAMMCGYELEFIEGWAWTALSNGFSKWVSVIDNLRRQLSGNAQAWVKLAAVGAIGRFGIDRYQYKVLVWKGQSLTREETERAQFITDCDTGEILYVVKSYQNNANPEYLVHVAAKVHADVRLRTLLRATPYAKEKRLVATNFDAIYYVGEQHGDTGDQFGEWKRKELMNATFPARRWIIADGLRKLPGLGVSQRNTVSV